MVRAVDAPLDNKISIKIQKNYHHWPNSRLRVASSYPKDDNSMIIEFSSFWASIFFLSLYRNLHQCCWRDRQNLIKNDQSNKHRNFHTFKRSNDVAHCQILIKQIAIVLLIARMVAAFVHKHTCHLLCIHIVRNQLITVELHESNKLPINVRFFSFPLH